jgi:hypothetical protein
MHFQDTRAKRLPWAKFIENATNDVHSIHYAICFKVEGKEMFIVFKFDNFLKYANSHKTKVANVNIGLGFLYFNLKC